MQDLRPSAADDVQMTGITDPAALPAAWKSFLRVFAFTAAGLVTLLYGAILALDPYGLFASPQRRPGPIMDLNQRFMYPQIVRGGRYDSAVFGTSTVRLLDPAQLDDAFGGAFANLAMNAATPWEQMQIAGLFLRETPRPRVLIFGIDATWCEADADRKRVTFRTFPPWLYRPIAFADAFEIFNFKRLEIALRVAAFRLHLTKARIRGDGYEVFTPPEASYDAARAKAHIGAVPPPFPMPYVAGEAERAAWRFPALPWLDDLLDRMPRNTRVILLFPPVHVAAQPPRGSDAEAREDECKRRVAAIGARHGGTVVDFRRPSAVTGADINYWDQLHYRLPIAKRLVETVRAIEEGTSAGDDGFYRVLTRTAKGDG
jgi:hypothetical protein